MRTITKIGLALIDIDNNMLLLKKKGLDLWISPGGKLELGETHRECADRECMEELNVTLKKSYFYYAFTYEGPCYGQPDTALIMPLYLAKIVDTDTMIPQNEIEHGVWCPMRQAERLPIVSSLKDTIIPWFLKMLDNEPGHQLKTYDGR